MKTIVFHSYKGGVGRTLCLANLGIALTKIGKKVLILDWDFDAPGLAIKYDLDRKVKIGYADYLVNIRQIYGDRIKYSDIEYRKKYLKNCIVKKDEEQGLYVLPAGDRWSEKYWSNISSKEFHDYFDYADDEKYRQSKNFFDEDLKIFSQVVEEESVDFLLIDSKTGDGRAVIPLMCFSDHVVELFNCNDEGIFGELHVRSAINNLNKEIDDREKIEMTSVMTRVPSDFGEGNALREYQKIAKTMLSQIDIAEEALPKKIMAIHEHRALEIYEELTLGKEVIKGVLLTHDYLNLFEEIFENDKTVIEEFKKLGVENWKAIFGLAQDVELIDRYFLLHLRKGYLINEDQEPNVSVKRDTFKAMVESLIKDQKLQLEKAGFDSYYINSNLEKAFMVAGEHAGRGFGSSAVIPGKVWKEGQMPLDTKERINKWEEFDTKAGFGKWYVDVDEEKRICIINIEDHFMSKIEYGDRFIIGYIKGVLSYLIPGDQSIVDLNLNMIRRDGFDLNY